MRIVLFDVKYTSAFSILCSLVTAQSYSHAAIVQGDKIYDTTLTRGYFAEADIHPDEVDRQATVFDFPDIDATEFIEGHLGVPYDTLGLLLWPLGIEDKVKTYCFQAASKCLEFYGISSLPSKISAKHIFYDLLGKGYKAERTTSGKLRQELLASSGV